MALKQLIKRIIYPRITARERWEQAQARYLSAKRRGDTRAQHDAWEALRAATMQKLRAGA